MNEITVIASGSTLTEYYWTLLKNDQDQYGLITTANVVEPKQVHADYAYYKRIDWQKFESTKHLDLAMGHSVLGYNKNSKLDFGMYEGYELGIVYSFDPTYIGWCINNIDKFCIEDLDELEKFGVLKLNHGYQTFRDIKVGDSWVTYFRSVQDIVEQIGMAMTTYRLNTDTKAKNSEKVKYLR